MPISHGMREVDTTFTDNSGAIVFDGTANLTADAQTDEIDLLTKTPYPGGLAVVCDIRATPTDADEVLDITIQGTNTPGSGHVTVATFKQITKTSGRSAVCIDTYVKRFYTNYRYIRLDLNVGGTTPAFNGLRLYLQKNGDERNQ